MSDERIIDVRCVECHAPYRDTVNMLTGEPVWTLPKVQRKKEGRCLHAEGCELLVPDGDGARWIKPGEPLP